VTGRDDRNGNGFGSGRGFDPGRDEDFVQGVLGRTSGSACGRCLDLLPALNDGALADLDRQLAQAHLENCTGCRAVAVTLGWLTPLLPDMAEIDPGDAFTRSVLDATTRRKAWEEAGPAGAAGLMDRLGRWWERQILKPQFAVQAAYAATLVLVLLTAVPGAPLRDAPGRALAVIQAGPIELPVVARASSWVDGRTNVLAGAVRAEAAGQWESFAAGWDRRAARTRDARAELSRSVGAMTDRIGAGESGAANSEFFAALRAAGGIWKNWWVDDEDVEP
jgi:hypothetical protein